MTAISSLSSRNASPPSRSGSASLTSKSVFISKARAASNHGASSAGRQPSGGSSSSSSPSRLSSSENIASLTSAAVISGGRSSSGSLSLFASKYSAHFTRHSAVRLAPSFSTMSSMPTSSSSPTPRMSTGTIISSSGSSELTSFAARALSMSPPVFSFSLHSLRASLQTNNISGTFTISASSPEAAAASSAAAASARSCGSSSFPEIVIHARPVGARWNRGG
mmetsp:Transcript_113091/g.351060  ORF Transcript_113091/g.351060 Transcript_113091/m.351060 type:complete len:222 (+) Transcript_113091:1349-2014(+)